jgi:hypothetical protein
MTVSNVPTTVAANPAPLTNTPATDLPDLPTAKATANDERLLTIDTPKHEIPGQADITPQSVSSTTPDAGIAVDSEQNHNVNEAIQLMVSGLQQFASSLWHGPTRPYSTDVTPSATMLTPLHLKALENMEHQVAALEADKRTLQRLIVDLEAKKQAMKEELDDRVSDLGAHESLLDAREAEANNLRRDRRRLTQELEKAKAANDPPDLKKMLADFCEYLTQGNRILNQQGWPQDISCFLATYQPSRADTTPSRPKTTMETQTLPNLSAPTPAKTTKKTNAKAESGLLYKAPEKPKRSPPIRKAKEVGTRKAKNSRLIDLAQKAIFDSGSSDEDTNAQFGRNVADVDASNENIPGASLFQGPTPTSSAGAKRSSTAPESPASSPKRARLTKNTGVKLTPATPSLAITGPADPELQTLRACYPYARDLGQYSVHATHDWRTVPWDFDLNKALAYPPPTEAQIATEVFAGLKTQTDTKRTVQNYGYPKLRVAQYQSHECVRYYGPEGQQQLQRMYQTRPWDDMWRLRVTRFYLLDPKYLDHECIEWIKLVFRFMYGYRQAAWIWNHWVHIPPSDSNWTTEHQRRQTLTCAYRIAATMVLNCMPTSMPEIYRQDIWREPAIWMVTSQSLAWVPALTQRDGGRQTTMVDKLRAIDCLQPVRTRYSHDVPAFIHTLPRETMVVAQRRFHDKTSWRLPHPWNQPTYDPIVGSRDDHWHECHGTPGPEFLSDVGEGKGVFDTSLSWLKTFNSRYKHLPTMPFTRTQVSYIIFGLESPDPRIVRDEPTFPEDSNTVDEDAGPDDEEDEI